MITEHAEWLPIRPTTDAALVAGTAHTLITEQLLDGAGKHIASYDRSTLPDTAAPNASYKDYVLVARAMTVSQNGMGGGYHRYSRRPTYSPTGARNRLGARLL